MTDTGRERLDKDIDRVAAWINSYESGSRVHTVLLGKSANILELIHLARQDERQTAWADIQGIINGTHFIFRGDCPHCAQNRETLESVKTVVKHRRAVG